MANSSRDANNVPTRTAVSDADGTTLMLLYADPTTHGLTIDDNTTGSDHGTATARRDSNAVPAMMAISSSDNKTPVALYLVAASNALKVNSN